MHETGHSSATDVAERWAGQGSGERYAHERFKSERAARRDLRLLASILRRFAPLGGAALDVPCGAGRLRTTLRAAGVSWVGADVSPSMLRAAVEEGGGSVLNASAFALPFADRAFELVVCCRLLHHLSDADMHTCIRELGRVSSRLVVASFWDAHSFHAWRQRRGAKPKELRRAFRKEEIEGALREAGYAVASWRHSFRFVSQQTFVAAVREG